MCPRPTMISGAYLTRESGIVLTGFRTPSRLMRWPSTWLAPALKAKLWCNQETPGETRHHGASCQLPTHLVRKCHPADGELTMLQIGSICIRYCICVMFEYASSGSQVGKL